jgi:uncharacterized membrane protein
MIQLQKENTITYCVYILFGFGGLWHILNWFQNAMRFLASPLIMAVCVLLLSVIWKSLPKQSKNRFLVWCMIVLCGGWGIECLGVYTHFPFGSYHYGDVLQPQIFKIPIAIGFSWLTISLSSLMIAFRITNRYPIKKPYTVYMIPVLTAVCMLIFDTVMEKAATKLNYWMWLTNTTPIQNYLSWFVLGVFFSWLWLKLKISMSFYPSFGIHVYGSQLLYFGFVLFKK